MPTTYEVCRKEIEQGYINLTDYTKKMEPANRAFDLFCEANHRPNITLQGKSTAKYCLVEADWISSPHDCGYTVADRNEILAFIEKYRFALKYKKDPFRGMGIGARYIGVDITRDVAEKLAAKLWALSDHEEKPNGKAVV